MLENKMLIWCKHSGEQVGTNSRIGKDEKALLALHSARNMTVSGQICMRYHLGFEILGVESDNLPAGVTFTYHFAECITFNDGVPYPDILSAKKKIEVKRHYTQGIWVLFNVANDVKIGEYEITLMVKTTEGNFPATFVLKVYSAVLPEPKDSKFSHEYFFSTTEYFSYKDTRLDVADRLPNFYRSERYSPEWWSVMKSIAQTMKFMRANVFWLPTLEFLRDAGSKRVGKHEWALNFDLVDKVIELFLEHGSFYRIVVKDHFEPADGKRMRTLNEAGQMDLMDVFTDEAESWAKAFYGGIYKHFEEKGWLSMLSMHLQDEPHSVEYWKWAREKTREYMPGIRCGEPFDEHHPVPSFVGDCDLYIPRVDIYEFNKEFYDARKQEGAELWTYTCCDPETFFWLNRFIDQPHVNVRQIMWACFSQDIDGYLHWGFNFWDSAGFAGLQPDARVKGDGFIVYPDAENNAVLLSARAIATTDGAQEWELLTMLAKYDEQKAKEIAATVAKSFSDFSNDFSSADRARKEILELLEIMQ